MQILTPLPYSSNCCGANANTVLCQHPFGMQILERAWTASSYRFGFNDMEKDDEISGSGNQYDYGFRIYNPRLGRFLSVDPLFETYPWFTPYQFSSNDPIRNIDIDGLEGGSAVENVIIDFADGYVDLVAGVFGVSYETRREKEKRLSQIPSPNKPAAPINTNSSKPVIKKTDFSNTGKKNIDLSAEVPFVSQFSLSNPNVACCRAAQKILKDFGIANGGAKSNRIITGRDNADHTAIAPTANAKEGVDYISKQLEAGNPVMVGLNHTEGKGQSDQEAADHFVVITGRAYDADKKQYYFNFYEVGTKSEENGKSSKNRLYVNGDNTITGTNYAGKREFTVTDVRKN